jgi:Protein of unknown function (DUF760)
MLDYVRTISPSTLGSSPSSGFDMPAPVLSAMRQTVANLLGTLPPQFFRVTISTRSDNLAQLMFSVLMTGYMFCNGWYRLQLAKSMGALTVGNANSSTTGSALVSSASASFGSIDDEVAFNTTLSGGSTTTATTAEAPTTGPLSNSLLAAGSQKLKVEGQVLKWHHEDGVQQVPALEYIEQLEEELQVLQRQLAAAQAAAQAAAAAAAAAAASVAASAASPTSQQPRSAIHETGQNELLEYLKGLSGEQVAELTDCATPDVLESMNALVRRMIGTDDDDSTDNLNNNKNTTTGEWGSGKSECSATELAQLLCWLMSVGHQLRTMEVRLSLLQNFENDGGGEFGPDDGASGDAASEWVPRLPPGR